MGRKCIDLIGMKFGRLTVIKRVENRGSQTYWLCRCECGIEKEIQGGKLKNGTIMSCGCLAREMSSKRRKENVTDLIGQKFGRLTVIKRAKNRGNQGQIKWLCQCECGVEKEIMGCSLKSGDTISCGCYNREKVAEQSKKNVVDLTGQKFGRWTVIKRTGVDDYRQAMWLCRCECGTEKEVVGSSLRNGESKSCGCWNREVAHKRMYKGGITPIAHHLRSLPIITQWRNDTFIRENYTCQLTGKKGGNFAIHHLKAFNTIVKEAHDVYGIEVKEIVADYTEEELKLIKDYVISWHKDTSNAILLSEEIHDLFHHEYGYGDNTKEQYEEFRERYLNGEFDNLNPTNDRVV